MKKHLVQWDYNYRADNDSFTLYTVINLETCKRVNICVRTWTMLGA